MEKRELVERVMLEQREGTASVQDIELLREMMLHDEQVRRMYLQSNRLTHGLEKKSSEFTSKKADPVKPVVAKRGFHLVSGLWGAGIAALLALGFVWFTQDHQLVETGAVAKEGKKAPLGALELGSSSRVAGSALKGKDAVDSGKLSLDQGIALINFKHGAQVVLNGRCSFEIIGEKHVVLNSGRLWAYCPPEAYGFKVTTPGGREIIDLGTEFGVEVNEQGETKVDVFDGLIQVKAEGAESELVYDGGSMAWSADRVPEKAEFVGYNSYVTSQTLRERRMQEYWERMVQRDDMLLYYNFDNVEGGLVKNQAKGGAAGTDAEVSKPIVVFGRTGNSKALLLQEPENSPRLTLRRPENVTSFTVAAWVNVSALQNSYHTILNSDGWAMGDIHFHITRVGGIRLGVKGGGAFESSSHAVKPGQWHMVVASVDLDKEVCTFYCDGKLLEVHQVSNGEITTDLKSAQFNEVTVGSWSRPKLQFITRCLNGMMDELMVFDHALSPQEVSELYGQGSP